MPLVWFEQRPIVDVNNDGRFSSDDLVLIFQHSEYEDDVSGNSTFLEGDWIGDGEFDSSNLVLAFQTPQYVPAARPRVSEFAAAVDWLSSRDHLATPSGPFVA